MAQTFKNVSDKPIALVTQRGGTTPVSGSLRIKVGETALVITLSGDWLQVMYKSVSGWIEKGNNPIDGDEIPPPPDDEEPPTEPPTIPPLPKFIVSFTASELGIESIDITGPVTDVSPLIRLNGNPIWP